MKIIVYVVSSEKRDREFKHLKSFMNYDTKEGTVGREGLKGKGLGLLMKHKILS